MNYKYALNPDADTRDKLIFGEVNPEAYSGGIRYFDSMTLATIQDLFAKGFINADDKQNDAPNAGEIKAFIERYPEYTAHGYAVSPTRWDYRVTFEGVTKDAPADSVEELKDFTELFKDAEEINTAIMDCWYD